MILGYFFGRKTYSMRKVVLVVTVVAGIMLFMYKDTEEKKDGENSVIGHSILAFSLLMDGCVGATEDRMRSVKKPTPLQLMFFVNLWSVFVGIVGIITFNEFPRFLRFVISYPEIFKYIGLTVLATISGQYFRNAMVANFGPLPMSIVGTIRKFTSVFLSVLLFGNSLSVR